MESYGRDKAFVHRYFMVSYLCEWYLDGISFCLPNSSCSPDAGSYINSWADQACGEIKTTESPGSHQ